MKIFFVLVLLVLPSTSYAGRWIPKGLYITHDILQGEGHSIEDAVNDAKATNYNLPEYIDFIEDFKSPGHFLECTVEQKIINNDIFCDPQIKGNLYRVSIPVKQIDLRDHL